jgi:hypothetical protein
MVKGEIKTCNQVCPSSQGQIWMIDERDLYAMLEEKGQECFGPKFLLWKEDYYLLKKLLIYFFSDQQLADRNNLDLKKGIILSGPVGCGKTSLMVLIRCFLHESEHFPVKPCREVAFEFHSTGFEIINQYSKRSFHKGNNKLIPKTYCFDDLGIEAKIRYYGNDCEVMKEIILSRYDLFERVGMLTHFTTNLTPEELEARYGEMIISRLFKMVNFISFERNAPDKRRCQ